MMLLSLKYLLPQKAPSKHRLALSRRIIAHTGKSPVLAADEAFLPPEKHILGNKHKWVVKIVLGLKHLQKLSTSKAMGFQYYQSILKTHKSSRMLHHGLRAQNTSWSGPLCTPYFVRFTPTIQAVAL